MTPRATAPPLAGAVGGKELPAVPASAGSVDSGVLFSAALLASLRLDPVTSAAVTIGPAGAVPEEPVAAAPSAVPPSAVPPSAPGCQAHDSVRAQVALTTVLQQLQAKLPAPGAIMEPVDASARLPEVKSPAPGKGRPAPAAKRVVAATADAAPTAGPSVGVAGAAALLAVMRTPAGDVPVTASPGRGKAQTAIAAALPVPLAPAPQPTQVAGLVHTGKSKSALQPDTADNSQPVPGDAAAAVSCSAAALDAPARSSITVLAELVSDISDRPQSRGDPQPEVDRATGVVANGTDLASQATTGLSGALQSAPDIAPSIAVAVPVADRQWAHAVATRVLVMAGQKIESATLRVNPEHLGPIEVHIDMQATHVNVSFGAAHVDTRNALELALPQLRAVLAGAGLTLGEASVQQQLRRESQNVPTAARTTGTAADSEVELVHQPRRHLTLIDEYV